MLAEFFIVPKVSGFLWPDSISPGTKTNVGFIETFESGRGFGVGKFRDAI